jgi:D-lactate dehydrogenase
MSKRVADILALLGKDRVLRRAIECSPTVDRIALCIARHWRVVEKLSRIGLRDTHAFSALFGVKPLTVLTTIGRKIVDMPRMHRHRATAVYVPVCIDRIFGHDVAQPDRRPLSLSALT